MYDRGISLFAPAIGAPALLPDNAPLFGELDFHSLMKLFIKPPPGYSNGGLYKSDDPWGLGSGSGSFSSSLSLQQTLFYGDNLFSLGGISLNLNDL